MLATDAIPLATTTLYLSTSLLDLSSGEPMAAISEVRLAVFRAGKVSLIT